MTWEIKTIKDLGKVVTGKTPSKEVSDYYENGELLFISPKDLDWNSYFVFDSQTKVTEKAYFSQKNQIVPRNAIFYTSLSFAIGKMGIASQDSLTNQQIHSIVVNDKNNFKFVYYLLQSYRPYIFSYNSGIDTPIVPKSTFEKIKINLPSLDIQTKIAGILSAYDELIENNKKRIALLEAMAEELYKEWFVRFRFPNYENTEFEKAVPKDWLERPTSELFEILGGGTPSKDEEEYWKDGEINWFTPSDLTKGSSLFIENSELKCNETGLSKSSAKLFPAFSIMMTSRATIGVLSINTTEACTNQGFITCLPNEQFPLTYLYFWLKFSKPYFDILANGATFAELSRGVFKKIKMRVPTQDLIDKFDNFCKPVFDEILNIQRQTENLTIQKNQLLPRLISGKLSVEHLNIQQPPTPAQPTDNE